MGEREKEFCAILTMFALLIVHDKEFCAILTMFALLIVHDYA